ncbi:MAG: CopG family transcriptional regulator [Nakamurella sp.]
MAMTLRLDDELDAQLTAVAAAERLSKQQVAVRALESYLQRHAHTDRVRALATAAAAEYSETLRRLGE